MVFYTAITLKLNTKPWNQTTSDILYLQQLKDLSKHFNCRLHVDYGFEMDKQCQMHIHATLVSKLPLFRKKVCTFYRKKYKNHSIWLRPVESLAKWINYCQKASFDERMAYSVVCKYYDKPDKYDIKNILSLNHKKIFKKNLILVNAQWHFEKVKQFHYKCDFI